MRKNSDGQFHFVVCHLHDGDEVIAREVPDHEKCVHAYTDVQGVDVVFSATENLLKYDARSLREAMEAEGDRKKRVAIVSTATLTALILGPKGIVSTAIVMGTLSGGHFVVYGTSGAERLNLRALRDSRLGPPGDTTWNLVLWGDAQVSVAQNLKHILNPAS